MLITRGRWVSWDTETTGVNPREARIVELACVRFDGAAPRSCYAARFNPGVPIPEPASQVHKIWDADVRDKPPLASCPHLDWLLGYPYLVGYNVLDYDGPLLAAEVARHRGDPAPTPPPGLDVLVLVRWFLRHWRHRKLEEVALRLRVPLEAAHSAADDATAAGFVLLALVEQGRVPDDWQAALDLQAQVRPQLQEEWRRFRHYLYLDREDGGLRCGFGKNCGRRLTDIRADWFDWWLGLADQDAAADPARAMPAEVREIFHAHAAGRRAVALAQGGTPARPDHEPRAARRRLLRAAAQAESGGRSAAPRALIGKRDRTRATGPGAPMRWLLSKAAVLVGHIHLPLDARDFAGGMATCGDEVDEEQMGILGGPLPGHTGKHSRRVTCPGCRTTTLEEAAARNAARPPPRYDRCPDRCQCLVHAAPGAVEHG